uniref:DUF7343 domain-containing protein n=1 Tax=Candidatus Methanogaster sp. ANME-2c ERB4 TaxID=2759911 RepID=A0A7G9YL86_9EURY|nr:uncharacterized membrane-associated protein [uncultured archaeon GZfos1D1]QNO48770.1 hypothetical protein BEOMFINI_00009 [Methanosarcinales archaeon ANME-2c ERB4]
MLRRCLLLIAIFVVCAPSAAAAVVHGTTYEWSTFEALENTIVLVNSTPPQVLVASSGSYTFDLPEGSYTIRAEYYRGNLLEYCAEEEITIVGDGDFVLDLLMFPPIEEAYLYEDINFSEDLFDYEELYEAEEDSTVLLYATGILSVLAIVSALFLWKRGKKVAGKGGKEDYGYEPVEPEPEAPEEPGEPEELEHGGAESAIPSDLQEVLSIIRDRDGRITQKDLRLRLNYSEAKASLMITDLEDRGLVKKVKKGRGNVIILTEL